MTSSENNDKAMKKMSAHKTASRILYALAALIVIIFGCFYLVGYDIPFEDDPQFNAPMLTDTVLIFVILLIGATLSATIFAIARELKICDREVHDTNRIPALRIAVLTSLLSAVCMAVTFAAGSSRPMFINGTQYTGTFWLKATDMFIFTITVLISAAVIIIITGHIKHNNSIKKGRKR